MNSERIIKNQKIMNALYIGVLCSVSYLAVYFARNVLGTVTPQMLQGGYTESYIGTVSSVYFVFYAVGQLINGVLGDKIKAKYMISLGLLLAGITNLVFAHISADHPSVALAVYGMTGFFLSMIYGPMTKIVAENTEPVYATRCSLGYTFASFFGSPLAGVIASFLVWQDVFLASSAFLGVMAVIFFLVCILMEKKEIIKYHQFDWPREEQRGKISLLLEHQIIKFTLISILTGVVRTTVVFWMPTYIAQYLGFSADSSVMIFSVATFAISFTSFIAVFIYECLKRNMDLTLLCMFVSSALFFGLMYFVKHPVLNVIFMVLAIMSSNGAATMLWSRYCPSLRDTGMVSGATGFLDFVSYIAAAVSSTLFSNAVSAIGWGNLILIWCGLMVLGVVVALPYKKSLKS